MGFLAFFKNHALAERAFSQPPCQRPLDMGCGFSTEDTKASDEERILKASDGVTGKAETTAQTRMGGALAKKSPAKRGGETAKAKSKTVITSARFNCKGWPKSGT